MIATLKTHPKPWLLLLVAHLLGASTVAAQLDASRIGWKRFTLKGSKLGFKVRSDITLDSRPAANALIEAPEHEPLAPRNAESHLLSLETEAPGQDSHVRFWFEPQDGRALQRSELSIRGSRRKHRTYRYTQEGVFVRTRRPEKGQNGDKPETWPAEDEFLPTDSDGQLLTEPTGLLYFVPASSLELGERDLVHVFSKGRIHPIAISVEELETIKVNYLEESTRGQRRVKGPVEAVRVALRPQLPAGETKSDFKLLGLEGNVDLFIDPTTRMLLQMSGRVKIAGGVRLRVQRVVLE